jgi:hypothetical protein
LPFRGLRPRTGCETIERYSCAGGAGMSKPDSGFDFDRYRKLLAEASDEPKRIALIELLVVEGARDKLAAQRGRLGREPMPDLLKKPPGRL